MHRSERLLLGLVRRFVVRLGQSHHAFGDWFPFGLLRAKLAQHAADGIVELRNAELLVEHHENLLGEAIRQPQLDQLPHEQRLVVLRIRDYMRGSYESRGIVDP